MKQIITSTLLLFIITAATAQSINFNSTELYPEGTAFSKKQNVFFVSSLHYGKISKVDFKGNCTAFINDSESISAIGIIADEKRNSLYVCISDPGVSVKTNTATQYKLAKLASYDLTTGKRKFIADLGVLNSTGGNFANDVTVDRGGNIYVTNSFSPIIFKITQQGKASVFTTSDLWKGEGFNLNGIVCTNDGYLLAAQSNTGFVYKIEIKNPKNISKVNTAAIVGADGLILHNENELIVVSNGSQKVHKIKTTDHWNTATEWEQANTTFTFPTTGVFAKNNYYILNAKLNEIFDAKAAKTSNFLLQEIKFDKK